MHNQVFNQLLDKVAKLMINESGIACYRAVPFCFIKVTDRNA
jgi:hypothetical protein